MRVLKITNTVLVAQVRAGDIIIIVCSPGGAFISILCRKAVICLK